MMPQLPAARKTAFVFLLLAAVIGVVLRLQHLPGFGSSYYRNFLHTHSHIAILGWVFSACYYFFYSQWIIDNDSNRKKYSVLLWLFIAADAGMLFSFPIQGYGAVSIAFSTLHILLQFVFSWMFLSDATSNRTGPISLRLAKHALFLQLFSAIGALLLGPVSAAGMAGSTVYFLCIYFYMHFQYNGWMTIAVLALFTAWLEQSHTDFRKESYARATKLYFAGVFPAYGLLTLWTDYPAWVLPFAVCGILLQVAAIGMMIRSARRGILQWYGMQQPLIRFLLAGAAAAFLLKITLQLLSAFPALSSWVSEQRSIIIAYIHLVLVGLVTVFLLLAFLKEKQGELRKQLFPVFLFGFSFAMTELLLVSDPFLPYPVRAIIRYFLFFLALVQLVSLFLLVSSLFRRNKQIL